MQVMLGRYWGSGNATTQCYEGKNALEVALRSRKEFPEPNATWGGTIVYRETEVDQWNRPGGHVVGDDEVRGQDSLSRIWKQESSRGVIKVDTTCPNS